VGVPAEAAGSSLAAARDVRDEIARVSAIASRLTPTCSSTRGTRIASWCARCRRSARLPARPLR
jgi:hypothetical protein